MQVITLGEELNTPIVLCLGYFGCMHKGHVELLETAKCRAYEHGARAALFTFSNNHLKVLGKDEKVLYTFAERLQIYESLGVEYVIVKEFDDGFRKKSGREFLRELCEYNLAGVVCGFDHRCGSDGTDSVGIGKILQNVCDVDVVNRISSDGTKVSTTLIKELLGNKRIDKANELLSEPFFLIGTVIHGRGVGKTMGFPTANITVASDKFLPSGVYGGRAKVDGREYRCIVNIGKTPTFGIDIFAVEAHLLDYRGDLYGKTVKVSLCKYLRDIVKFDNADALAKQLQKDKENARND